MAKSSYRKLLYNGGELFINKLGDLFHVDVFDADWEPSGNLSEPVYHATYSTLEEAMEDASLWKVWPEQVA